MKRIFLVLLTALNLMVIFGLAACASIAEEETPAAAPAAEVQEKEPEKTLKVEVDVENSDYILIEKTKDKVELVTPGGQPIEVLHNVDFSSDNECNATVRYTDAKGEEKQEDKIFVIGDKETIEERRKQLETEEQNDGDQTVSEKETTKITVGQFRGKDESELKKTAEDLGLVPDHDKAKDAYSDTIAKGKIVWHGSGDYEEGEKIRYGLSLGKKNTSSGDSGKSDNSGNNPGGSEKKGHWENVLVKEAWDEEVTENVLVKDAWTEKVLVKDAWDETVQECTALGQDSREVAVCNYCGYVSDGSDIWDHCSTCGKDGGGSSFRNDREYYGEVHCLAYDTSVIHHDAEYSYIQHDAEYKTVTKTVHHDAEYKQVWVED